MGFEKIKNALKELNDISTYQYRGRKSYIPFISAFFLMIFVISLLLLYQFRLNNIQEFLFTFMSGTIYFCLICLTIMKIEKYKQKYNKLPFEKFLKPFVKIDNYLKNKKILQVFLSLFMLLIIFIVMCLSFVYAVLFKSEIILIFAIITLFTFIFSTCSFIYDLILLAKNKFGKQKLQPEQKELKEDNNYENI